MQIKLSGIHKFHGRHETLKGVDLTIFPEETVAILGPSGGGKSTLLRLIGGLDIPDAGSMEFDGIPLRYDETSLIAHRQSIGTVFQSWNLFPHLTAEENICLPLEKVHGMDREEALSLSHDLLSRFGLKNHARKFPGQLSGGQCQRIAIVRAVAIKPRLLLFDEPTSALDPIMTCEVLDLIAELKSEGRHFVLISHHVSFAKKVADRIVFLSAGRIVDEARTKEFFSTTRAPEVDDYLSKGLKY